MRAVIQRVSESGVIVENYCGSAYQATIGKGLMILLGVAKDDEKKDADYLAGKCVNLRIFEDAADKMNYSVKDINGEILVISQFTLYGDARKGNRPNFTEAAEHEKAKELYEYFIEKLEVALRKDRVKSGIFAAMMKVKMTNYGPVTIIIDSAGRK